jgi:hypothetical protein
MNVAACFALLSKEIFICVPVVSLIITVFALRNPMSSAYRYKLTFLLCMSVSILIFWVSFKLFYGGIGAGGLSDSGDYSISLNLSSSIRNLVFTLGAPFNPVPTALVSISDLASQAYIVISGLFFCAIVFCCVTTPVSITWPHVVFIGAIILPQVVVTSAELYASVLYPVAALCIYSFYRRFSSSVVLPLVTLLALCSVFNFHVLSGIRCSSAKIQDPSGTCLSIGPSFSGLWQDGRYSLYSHSPDQLVFHGYTLRQAVDNLGQEYQFPADNILHLPN